MRVLFLTQWFEPEPIMKGIAFAKALAAAGLHVEVCTGVPNYPHGKVYPGFRLRLFQRQVMEGVQVDRLFLYPSHDRSTVRRALNFLSFFVSSLVYTLIRGRRFDVVYVYHPPITVGLAAALSGLITGRPFILDIQDLWPDSVAASGMSSSSRLSRWLNPICNFVYRRARAIVAQSQGMRERLIERGVPPGKVVTIYNWADEEATEPRGLADLTPYAFADRFNIVYAGNMGRVQGLETLVQAAALARDCAPRIQLLLIGGGVDYERLAEVVQSSGATNVLLRPGIPREQIADVLAAADALVVHLIDDPLFEITVPSKVQFYLAMAKPIIVAVKGEASRIVQSCGAGVAVASGDADAMAQAMIEMSRMTPQDLAEMGSRGAACYRNRFAFAAGVAATVETLRQAAGANAL
jgi:colanic acid biosynthesis glycosyl transferase WcaI